MPNNKYYETMSKLIENALSAFDDGKVTVAEVWAFLLLLGETVTVVINEASHWGPEDTLQVKDAASTLYRQFVEPLDIPGPDLIIDPLLRDVIIPGLVEGAVRLARSRDLTAQKFSV